MGDFGVLIVDSNSLYLNLFREHMEKTGIFSRYYFAEDGNEAIDIIRKYKPELVITSLVMERCDGISLIESITHIFKAKKPKMIVISNLMQQDVIEVALNKGASLYFSKGIEQNIFVSKIRELMLTPICAQPKSNVIHSDRDILQRITKEIQMIGLPSSSMGYKYVRYAIKMVVDDDSMLENVMTGLYPMIAEKFNTNTACVERNIRHAIESAWNHGSMVYIDKVFGYSIDADKGKPTNRAFIATIADRVRLHFHLNF